MKEIKLYSVRFDYVKFRGQRVIWEFKSDIPELIIIASPYSEGWKKRVEEEIKVFNIWKKFNPQIPFKNLRMNPLSAQQFLVDVDFSKLFDIPKEHWSTLILLLPIRYPYSMPEIDYKLNRKFWILLSKWTRNHPFCMPPIMNRWWYSKRGRAGIAHFLKILLFFITLAGRKRTKVDVKLKEFFFE